MTYLVTGATGNIGTRIVKRLIARGIRPRVFVRDPSKAESRFGNDVEVFVGDLDDKQALMRAMDGVSTLMLITSGKDLARYDRLAAEAALAAKVGLIVKLSSYDAGDKIGTGVWHADGEAAIEQSGIPHVFIRPAGFQDNLLHWVNSIKTEGVVRSPSLDGAVALIHPNDIADVAVEMLTGNQSEPCLTITGPRALTFGEVTAMLSTALGRTVRYEDCTDEDIKKLDIEANLPADVINARSQIMKAIRGGLYAKVSDGVQRVLGRSPIDVEVWIAENKNAFV